jgi:NADPH:quinone reductase-like Zn-dependent oxidoreductase
VHDTKVDELSENMVEIRIHCVGVNFRDILKSRGLYPYMRPFAQFDKEQPLVDRDTELGLDFVGTVLRCHANNKVKSGDRVVGMSWRGMFHSHRHVDIREVVRIPNEGHQFTEEQLAAMPNACVTVLYSLKYRVNLRPDQTVLVHAATGGTGQACIQYCQSVGARVFATAGSEEKRRFLREHYGIEHVFNSRDLSFVQGIRTILPDGIDVVVNSLSGALLQESIKLLSSQGHFVEWGKRDVFDKSHLSMFDFRNDCSFHIIDVSSLVIQQPDFFGRILEEVVQLIIQGVFKPIDPTNVYEPSKIIEVFKLCNSGQVIGKCIIRLTSSEQPLALNDQQMASGIEGRIICLFSKKILF